MKPITHDDRKLLNDARRYLNGENAINNLMEGNGDFKVGIRELPDIHMFSLFIKSRTRNSLFEPVAGLNSILINQNDYQDWRQDYYQRQAMVQRLINANINT